MCCKGLFLVKISKRLMLEGFTKSLANIKANELFKGVNYEKYCFLVKKSIAYIFRELLK